MTTSPDTELTITFPYLPDPELCGNQRGGWHWRVNRLADAKSNAVILAKEAMQALGHKPGGLALFFDSAILRIEFQMPDLRYRDLDNLVFGCKAWIDGCIAAGVLETDDWRSLRGVAATAVYAPKQPLTIFTFLEVGENDNVK